MAAKLKFDPHLEIAHVLFIDVVGYSKLLVNEQREVVEQLNRAVRKTPQFRKNEGAGKLIRIPVGDGMALVFFQTPEQPVQCAMEIARVLKNHPQIRLRMGVHSGPVDQVKDVNDRLNLAGAGMNTAQRVMACGDAGHILLSKRVAEDLAQDTLWQPHLHELGEIEVKHGRKLGIVNLYSEEIGNPNVPDKLKGASRQPAKRPVQVAWPRMIKIAALLLVCLLAAVAVIMLLGHRGTYLPTMQALISRSPARKTSVAEKSIAVLPFENLSHDPDNAYFADGIQEEILARLAKIADLKVISRTSTQHYKSSPDNLPQIAKRLGVANILEGSVQKSADKVRVNVELIRAATDTHLWADTFDRKLTDVFAIESEVARAIADTLQAKLTGAERNAIAAWPTENTEAYQLYLKGRFYAAKGMYREALLEFGKYSDLDRGTPRSVASLGYAHARLKERGEALGALDQLMVLSNQRYVSAASFATVYLGLGDKEQAFNVLEKAYEERSAGLPLLKVNPIWDPLRSDPRFEALVTKVFSAQKSTTQSP
jgi:TolB-like protein